MSLYQCCGSGSWIQWYFLPRDVDTGIQDGNKMQIRDKHPDKHISEKNTRVADQKFMFLSVGWPLLRSEGLFYNLDVRYGGPGIGKM
jgi:hypothetical protein